MIRRPFALPRAVRPAALSLGVAWACVIPDRDIDTEDVKGNPGAVRIVEPTNLTADFLQDCIEGGSTTCPQVPSGRRSGLVALPPDTSGALQPFCICPEGSTDTRTVDEFFIYAEDPDRVGRAPKDTLYAVALRDLDPLTSEPQAFVAYNQHLEPGAVGEPFSLDQLDPDRLDPLDVTPDDADATSRSLLSPSLEREDNGLFRFRFGKNNGEGADLCNDDVGRKLPPGIHTLQIMVTDRPFFRPVRRDADGNPVVGIDGQPQFDAVQYGMPDIAAGATWSIANYVFECVAESVDVSPNASVCGCTPVEGQ